MYFKYPKLLIVSLSTIVFLITTVVIHNNYKSPIVPTSNTTTVVTPSSNPVVLKEDKIVPKDHSKVDTEVVYKQKVVKPKVKPKEIVKEKPKVSPKKPPGQQAANQGRATRSLSTRRTETMPVLSPAHEERTGD